MCDQTLSISDLIVLFFYTIMVLTCLSSVVSCVARDDPSERMNADISGI